MNTTGPSLRRRAGCVVAVGALGLALGACGVGASGHKAAAPTSAPVTKAPPVTTATSIISAPPTVSPTSAPTPTTSVPPPGLASSLECGTESPSAFDATGPVNVQVTDGAFSATLTGTLTGGPGLQNLVGGHLVVTDSGQSVANTALVVPAADGGTTSVPFTLINAGTASSPDEPLCLAQFPGDPAPTVVVGYFTGGAHCCVILAAVPLGGQGAGTPIYSATGEGGDALEVDDGDAIIVSSDGSFAYTFASYAASGQPLRILEVQNGRFITITQNYPHLLDSDDLRWWNLWQQNPTDGLGLLAAWVGDECLIGTGAHALSTLDLLNSQGKLTSEEPVEGTGSTYIANMEKFLTQQGYSC